jgi:hypothetical protein
LAHRLQPVGPNLIPFVNKLSTKGAFMLIHTVKRVGRISYGLAAMLLGLPLPVVLLALMCGGCTRW